MTAPNTPEAPAPNTPEAPAPNTIANRLCAYLSVHANDMRVTAALAFLAMNNTVTPWTWSKRDLRASGACFAELREADLDWVLCRVVPEDEQIPALVWLGLRSTSSNDAMWVVRVGAGGPPSAGPTRRSPIVNNDNLAYALQNLRRVVGWVDAHVLHKALLIALDAPQ